MDHKQTYRYLLYYAREGVMAWLAHLDTMSCFERSLKRAGIPLEWGGGFNPRPKLVFALPIGMGIECEADLVEISVTEKLKTENLAEHITNYMPDGLVVWKVEPSDNQKSLMSLVNQASYLIEGDSLGLAYQELLNFYKDQDILVERLHKGKTRTIDIKDLIISSEILGQDSFRFTCKAGSSENLRPDLVLKAITDHNPKMLVAANDARIVRESLGLSTS